MYVAMARGVVGTVAKHKCEGQRYPIVIEAFLNLRPKAMKLVSVPRPGMCHVVIYHRVVWLSSEAPLSIC